ncbi:hypothetical protein [Methylocystis parvus]|uniref:hypothetical protein n=1 Tax=Methylocystis parvus TaxID=134 RepID=UPI003C721DCE
MGARAARSAVGKEILLSRGPASEGFVDREQFDFGEALAVFPGCAFGEGGTIAVFFPLSARA